MRTRRRTRAERRNRERAALGRRRAVLHERAKRAPFKLTLAAHGIRMTPDVQEWIDECTVRLAREMERRPPLVAVDDAGCITVAGIPVRYTDALAPA